MRGLLVLSLGAALLSAEAAAAPATAGRPITNKVLDLLNGEIALHGGNEPNVWESAPFDTSQFSWIGVRTADDGDGVYCQTAWQLTPGDPFEVGFPAIRSRNTYFSGLGVDPPIVISAPTAGVQGLRARIVCRAFPLFRLGDDVTPAAPAEATLTDVKVLLRHW